jgi:hypothetical protein
VFLRDESTKTLKKTFYKKVVSKSFYKQIEKNRNRLSLGFVLSRFWAFLGEGSKKNTTKTLGNSPGTFLVPEEPTHHVKARHFCF